MVGLRACPEATFKVMGILPLGFCDFRMVEIFGNLCHGVAEVDDLVTRGCTKSDTPKIYPHQCAFFSRVSTEVEAETHKEMVHQVDVKKRLWH